MIRKSIFFLMALLFAISTSLFAQHNDSTHGKWYEFGKHNWFKFKFHGNPFIELTYGLSSIKHDKLISSFYDEGLAEIKLGYATDDSFEEEIITFDEKFVFGSKLSPDFKSGSAKLTEMKSTTYRFGLGKRTGYGYEMNNFSILPYYSEGMVWTRIDMIDYPGKFWIAANLTLDQANEDTNILNRFHNNFRFGQINEAGIRIEYNKSFSINAGYEFAVVFPRHMVWKHLGSAIIENAGLGLLDHFIDEVADASPYTAPIVNFLLKNGYTLLFYSLKKDKMNWPFETETPLRYETFKFGITVTF